jgi:SAM-dependent methyltransferase
VKPNTARLQAFLARSLNDLAAAQSAMLVCLGDRLGLYRAMNGAGPLSPELLAERASLDPRYVREWLINQAAGGYVEYEPATGCFELRPEQASVLAEEDSAGFLGGAFQLCLGLSASLPALQRAFETGEGIALSSYPADAFEGARRLSETRLRGELLSRWIPALQGLGPRLEAGVRVAEVGCGAGNALLLLAEAFPRSRFVGVDPDPRAVEHARERVGRAGFADRVQVELASAEALPGEGYGLILAIEVFHEMADPLGAARRLRTAVGEEGVLLLTEAHAGERIEEMLHPWGRLVSAVSTAYCLPSSRTGSGSGWGGLVSEAGLRELLIAAGFGSVRRVGESPWHLVLEVRA